MDGKVHRQSDELVRLIRLQLAGKYSTVAIRIERNGKSWIAIPEVDSDVTRERIESAVRRVREYNELA